MVLTLIYTALAQNCQQVTFDIDPCTVTKTNYLKLHIKTDPVVAGADETVIIRILFRNQTYTVASAPAPAVIGSVHLHREGVQEGKVLCDFVL